MTTTVVALLSLHLLTHEVPMIIIAILTGLKFIGWRADKKYAHKCCSHTTGESNGQG